MDILNLADHCRAADEPSRVLDGEIFKALHEKSGDVWSNDIGSDGVWHRRDPEDHVAWEGPPQYTGSIDAAAAEVTTGLRIAQINQFGLTDASKGNPYWRPWRAHIHIGELSLVIRGVGATMALAIMDGLLRSLAERRSRARESGGA